MRNTSFYSEVRNTNYDDISNYWTIDAWKSADDNEEGEVVAVVNGTTGDVWYCNPEARLDKSVRDSINELLLREFGKDVR